MPGGIDGLPAIIEQTAYDDDWPTCHKVHTAIEEKKMDCRKAALLPAACMLASLVASQAPLCAAAPEVKGVKQLTSIEGITEYELPNGFKVLLFPDASKPTVTINMTVLVGSRHEGYGEAGMAHLLEHMLFKGTPPVSRADVDSERHERARRAV